LEGVRKVGLVRMGGGVGGGGEGNIVSYGVG